MHIRFRFSADEKYWRLDSLPGRKFGVIDTPKILAFSPYISETHRTTPKFFHCCIQRPNVSQAAK